MITFSNGHQAEHFVASGALAFDGRGWLWDKPLIAAGLIDPGLFTVVARTVSLEPRLYPVSNLSWLRPWTWLPWSSRSCVRFLPDNSAVNKVGLYNPGFDWWCREVGSKINSDPGEPKLALAASIFGTERECVEMALALNKFDLVAVELNDSCPNTGHGVSPTASLIANARAVRQACRFPLIVKLSVAQDYVAIAKALEGNAEAISFNSVPWEIAFPDGAGKSPLAFLEKKKGGGGGGVSGKAAQKFNWHAMQAIHRHVPNMPLIASSIMEYEDIERAWGMGASAYSYGAVHLKTPWKPTAIVRKYLRNRGLESYAHVRREKGASV